MSKLKLVQIQTTSICNGHCIMCPYKDSWFVKNPGYMNDGLYIKILNDILEYDPNFSGTFCPYLMNEPFADKQILERIAFTMELLPKAYIEISSNFSLLTNDTISRLVELYATHMYNGRIMVSFHGMTPKSHMQIMGLAFDKCLENTIYLLKELDGKMPVYIQSATASRDHKCQFATPEDYNVFWQNMIKKHKLNASKLIIYPLQFHNRAGNVQLDSWKYTQIVRQIDRNHPFDCKRLYGNLHVLYNGEVVLCCCDYQHETVFGNLNKQTVKEVFLSDAWQDLKRMVRGYKDSSADFICKRCTWPGG